MIDLWLVRVRSLARCIPLRLRSGAARAAAAVRTQANKTARTANRRAVDEYLAHPERIISLLLLLLVANVNLISSNEKQATASCLSSTGRRRQVALAEPLAAPKRPKADEFECTRETHTHSNTRHVLANTKPQSRLEQLALFKAVDVVVVVDRLRFSFSVCAIDATVCARIQLCLYYVNI